MTGKLTEKRKKVKFSQLCPTLCDATDWTEFSRPEYWSGQPFPYPGIILTLGLNSGLPNPGIKPRSPNFRWILYQQSHKGSPRILEWTAYPLCNGPSPPRNWTWVSCIAGRFFTSWATREAPFGKLFFFFNVSFPDCTLCESIEIANWLLPCFQQCPGL